MKPRGDRPRPWLDHYDYWVPAHTNYPRRPLYEVLRRAAAEGRDLPATTFLGADLTFGEIKDKADRFATALARHGIAKGDRVGIMLPNCPPYLIGVFAVLRLGAIVVNINPAYTPSEVDFILRDSGVRMVLTLDVLAPALAALQPGPPSPGFGGASTALETIVITSIAEYSPAGTPPAAAAGVIRMVDLIAEAATIDLPRVPIDADDDVAVLQYTGGTTGVPKAAMLTHRNIFANTIQTELWHSRSVERGHDRFLLVIPYFHIYGLTVGLMRGVWQGARQIQIPKYDVEAVLTALRDYQPTYFPAVPTIFVSLLNHPRVREFNLDRVCTYNSGSAPLPGEVLEKFERVVNVKKDMMIVDGFNVYPSEVEAALYSHPSVMEAAAIGVPSGYHGEVVKAVVVLKPNQAATADELRAHCAGHLAEFKRPRTIEIRASLPKSSVGKVLYTKLRAEAAAAISS